MIRSATHADIPRILEIRDGARENRLTNLDAVTEAVAKRFADGGTLWVWQEAGGPVVGFAAIDVGTGSVRALLVAAGHEGKGIGRKLLNHACDALRDTGHCVATIALEPGISAERHYRAAGWTAIGDNDGGERVFRKPL